MKEDIEKQANKRRKGRERGRGGRERRREK